MRPTPSGSWQVRWEPTGRPAEVCCAPAAAGMKLLKPLPSRPRAAQREPLPSLLHPRESFNARIALGFGESFAFAKATFVIELKQFHGGPTDRVRRVDANGMQ